MGYNSAFKGLILWFGWKRGMGTWLLKLKILRLRTAILDDNFVKTTLVFSYFSVKL